MSVAASILSVILFLAFATSGVQKIRFNPMMSGSAEHLGFSKSAYQRIGALEVAGALGVILGVASKSSNFFGALNVAAAVGLVLMMVMAVSLHLRKGDDVKVFAPAIALAVISLLEVIFRLA